MKHRMTLREISKLGRRRSRFDLNHGLIASDGMGTVAAELWLNRVPFAEAVRRYRENATARGVLDQVHLLRCGPDLDGPHLVPGDAIYRQSIGLLEDAGDMSWPAGLVSATGAR